MQTKQHGLERLLVYDAHPRKALVDHFYSLDVALEDLIDGQVSEQSDFVTGTYLAKVQREAARVALVMERQGRVFGHLIRLTKTIELSGGAAELAIHYELDDVPAGACLHLAVEINVAGMAGHAPDRYYAGLDGTKLGLLDDRLDLAHSHGVSLNDLWLDRSVQLTWSQSAGLWCFPIETVNHSDGGIEEVYQSSAVIPHWHVAGDENGHWDLRICWRLDRATAADALEPRGSRLAATSIS
jgi:alpha-amylase